MHEDNRTQTAKEIREFLSLNLPDWLEDSKEYDGMDLTIAINDDWSAWNYQTGDNSYTGGAYGLPHWAVTTIHHEYTDLNGLCDEIFDQLEDLIHQ